MLSGSAFQEGWKIGGVRMTEQWAFLFIFVLVMIFLLATSLAWRLSKLEMRIAKLFSVDAKLDILLKHSGLDYDPYKNLPHEVAEAVQSGKKIEAIKRYREATGVGLKEAKEFIEEIQRRGVG
jgi:hypothetical protein